MAGDDLLREAQDPSTPPARLAAIAQTDRSTWRAVAGHPQAYDGLLAWLDEHGDDEVRATIAARAAASAVPPPPPPPPPSGVTPPPSAPPAPTQPLAVATGRASGPPAGPPSGPPSGPPAGPPYGQPLGSPAGPPSRSSSKGVAIWAVVAVVVLAALGVGGYFGVKALSDDDSSTASSETRATDSSEPSDSGSPSSEESTDGDDSDGGADAAFCSTIKEQQEASMELLASPGADPDIDKLKSQLEESAEIYNDLADDAPAEISDDLRTIADYYEVLQSVSDGSGDPSDFSSQIEPFSEASQRLSAYYYKNCS